MGGAHAEGSQKREPRAHSSHRGATVLALVVGAVALVCAALAVGTLCGPQVLRAYVPTLADDLGILVEPEPELERLQDGYDGELARRVAAVANELTRSAYDAPDLDEATAGALQGLLLAADDHGRYLTEGEYRALIGAADGDAAFDSDGVDGDAMTGEPANAAQAGQKTSEWRAFGSVDAWLDGVMGVIRVADLGPGTAENVEDAIVYLNENGAQTFTLDLTDNPGGSLNEAVALASLFLNGGTVAELIEPDGTSRRLRVNAGACVTDAPLAVLVSSDTGSAAELVVGALKDHRRALVIGQTTAGRGTVQSIKTLSFGGAVVYATAEFLTPDGDAVEGVGIEPDFAIESGALFAVEGDAPVDAEAEGAGADRTTTVGEGASSIENASGAVVGSLSPEAGGSGDVPEGAANASAASDEYDELDFARAALDIWVESGHIADVLKLDENDVAAALRLAPGSAIAPAASPDAPTDAHAEGIADAQDGAASESPADASADLPTDGPADVQADGAEVRS